MTDTASERPEVLKKGFLPAGMNAANSDVAVHVNHFPLGDMDNFSVARAAYAKAQDGNQGFSGRTWSHFASWEKAYFEALSRVSYKAGRGDQVSGLDGAFLAPEAWSSKFFGLLRSLSALNQLPITRVSVPARVDHLAKVTGDVTVSYPGEGNAPSPTQFSFGQLSYTARKADALINVSNELIRDAADTADAVLRQEGAAALAVDRDYQAFVGIGGSQPTGLVNNPAVTKYYVPSLASATLSATAAHGTPSFYHVSQLKVAAATLNGQSIGPIAGQAICNGIVTHARFDNTVYKQSSTAALGPWSDAQGRPLWMGGLDSDGGVAGLNFVYSNLLPTASTDGGGTASTYMIAGWWQQYVLFECLALGFDSTTEGQGFGSDQTQVRIKHRYDCGPAHPEAFAVLAGVDQ